MNSICIDIEEGFIQKLAIILHQDNLKNRMNSSFSPYHPGAINFFPCHPGAIDHFLNIFLVQNSLRGKELNKFCPPNSNDDLCLLLCVCVVHTNTGQHQQFFSILPTGVLER